MQAARFLRGARRKAWEWRSEARATGGINSEAGWIQAGGSGAGRRRDKIELLGEVRKGGRREREKKIERGEIN